MTDDGLAALRAAALRIFARTLAAVDVHAAVERALALQAGSLQIGSADYPLTAFSRVMIVAVGKASAAMAEAAVAALTPHLTAAQTLHVLVTGPVVPALSEARYFAGAHPLPDAASHAAAIEALALLRQADAETLVVFLISGGASAMLEAPATPAISMDDLVVFYRELVLSGLNIAEINTLRKQVSAVKGGRLARAAGEAVQLSLIVSDVPLDMLDMVASGPTLPDLATSDEVSSLYALLAASTSVPPSIANHFASGAWNAGRVTEDSLFLRAARKCILSSEHLQQAACAAAEAEGFRVLMDNTCDDWECDRAATYLLDRSREFAAENGGATCVLSVGEVLVNVTGAAGDGGRNQHFALACALELQTRGDSTTVVLSAGSDGIDGHSAAAGAVADAGTCRRAAGLGHDSESALRNFDSGSLFRVLGDAIVTGPTGNNLRDLRLIVRHA